MAEEKKTWNPADFLEDDEELKRRYAEGEKRYLDSMKNGYDVVNIDFCFSDEREKMVFKCFIKALAKTGMCFDEWVANALKNEIVAYEQQKLLREEESRVPQ